MWTSRVRARASDFAGDDRSNLYRVTYQHQAICQACNLLEAEIGELIGFVNHHAGEALVISLICPGPLGGICDHEARTSRDVRCCCQNQEVAHCREISGQREVLAYE